LKYKGINLPSAALGKRTHPMSRRRAKEGIMIVKQFDLPVHEGRFTTLDKISSEREIETFA
jgi:hypothetical protein